MAQKRDLKPITVYLPDDLIATLKHQASSSHDSVSTIVRRRLLQGEVVGRDRPLARPIQR